MAKQYIDFFVNSPVPLPPPPSGPPPIQVTSVFIRVEFFCKRRAPRVSSLKMRGVKRKAEQVLIDTKKVT